MRFRNLLPVAALLSVAASAHGGIITALSGSPVAVSNGYAYTYNVSLTGQLDATGPNTDPQFGTLYDFGPILTSVSNQMFSATGLLASSFLFTFSNTSLPTAFATTPDDDPNRTNIRFTYTGSTNYVDSGNVTSLPQGSYTVLTDGPTNLGTFTVISPDRQTDFAFFDGQDRKPANDTMQGNVGLAAVPSPVPEPSSLALLGTGMLGAVTLIRRRMNV